MTHYSYQKTNVMDQISLEKSTETLRSKLGASFEWTCDDRFQAILSEYDIQLDASIRELLNEHFTQR